VFVSDGIRLSRRYAYARVAGTFPKVNNSNTTPFDGGITMQACSTVSATVPISCTEEHWDLRLNNSFRNTSAFRSIVSDIG